MRGKAKHRSEAEIAYDIETGSKLCKVCGERKSFFHFSKKTRAPDQKCNTCSDCLKAYRTNIKEHTAKYKKAYYLDKQEYIRYKRLYDKYGVTKEWYIEQLEKQQHKCAICACDEPRGNGNIHFHVDHCHSTGKVRGLLCSSCNTALGSFKDSTELMLKAIEYINKVDKEI